MASPKASDEEKPTRKKRNAFSELMSPKAKQPKPPSLQPTIPTLNTNTTTTPNSQPHHTNARRDGLLSYIQNPTSFPPSRVIYHNASFVVIRDLYPKASIHLLLLPRNPTKYLLHPFIALSDPVFLASVRTEATRAQSLAAKELRRLFGPSSASDQAYHSARDSAMDSSAMEPAPAGRDWAAELLVGIHAHPSMAHLHIHIISADRHSECLRHRKHYNSFTTPFFVPLADFPLAEDDVRRHPGREGYLKRDFVCWRCGREFGNRFARLKEHLEEEFEAWKRE